MSHIKIGKGIGNVSEETLRFYSQIGVEEVSMPTRYHVPATDFLAPRPLVPPTQSGPKGDQGPPWDESELIRVKDRFESFGLIPTVSSLGLSGNITMGTERKNVFKKKTAARGRLGLAAVGASPMYNHIKVTGPNVEDLFPVSPQDRLGATWGRIKLAHSR